ncbi:MAG: mechanosensitive ion channel [Myxococcales bacterium]|nr:mechanosensitive ion channel [Myxococcales bacterium]
MDVDLDVNKMAQVLYGLSVEYGLRVLGALAILLVGRWMARWVSRVAESALVRAKVDGTLVRFLRNLTYSALLAAVGLAVLSQLGVQTASFLAVLGAAGLAVGLALQGSLSNFAAGVLLILFRPFKVGDFVEAGGTAGTVAEIQLFTTILFGPDNRKFIVPNSQILSATITNFSDIETRRVDMVFGISYQDDIPKAKALLDKLVKEETRILAEPVPVIAVSELGPHGVDLVVRPWVKPDDYWNVRFDFTERVKLAFDQEGISIPFPQRDVHIKSGQSAKLA